MGCTLTQARQSALCGLQVGLKAGSSGLAKEEVGCTYPEPILGGLRAALYVKRAAFVSGPALHMYLSSADLISILTSGLQQAAALDRQAMGASARCYNCTCFLPAQQHRKRTFSLHCIRQLRAPAA